MNRNLFNKGQTRCLPQPEEGEAALQGGVDSHGARLLLHDVAERLCGNCFHIVGCTHRNKFVHLSAQQFKTVKEINFCQSAFAFFVHSQIWGFARHLKGFVLH